ncbi:hypothetical protein MBLNU459_g5603t1 [Dothideomycetes sp. NU459]
MGKPRMIILIRHAQSEGNKNRDIHQMIPDHRVKLTPEGRKQVCPPEQCLFISIIPLCAEEAGKRLRSMLKPDDTLQFFTSPYRRTRETTEGILSSLTSDTEEDGPSPFPRHTIKVFEEPRIREQDFGNFQPCSAEMERMWQERADYGHFFYRIPDGESAADAYDRISGFNESLWRNFNDDDFPSVCVLVTHGLMTRVFLMKWYHWSVEYFEDLRNVNHCEFVIMKQNLDNGKYILENQLRTWSELKRKAAMTQSASSNAVQQSPAIPARQWGGCVGGCNHNHSNYPRRTKRSNTLDAVLPPPAEQSSEKEKDEIPSTPRGLGVSAINSGPQSPTTVSKSSGQKINHRPDISGAQPANRDSAPRLDLPAESPILSHFKHGRDFGGSLSGAATPAEGLSDSSDYFNDRDFAQAVAKETKTPKPKRRPTEQDISNWAQQSGMGTGARAERLGDEEVQDEDVAEEEDDAVEACELEGVKKDQEYDQSLKGSIY